MTDELAAIRRPFGPVDLAPELAAVGVDGTVLVQSRSSVDETRELLAVAERTSFVRGVVGWVDLTYAGVADTITELRARPGGQLLVGIRHQVHDEPDPAWLDRREVRRGIRAVGDLGLVYDLLVRTRELPAATRLVHDLPDVRFVVDHLAKPRILSGELEPWASSIARLGPFPNVSCKVSGLVTEADWASWRSADLQPYLDLALATFRPERLLFGSDWPVCLLAGGYSRVVEATRTCLARLSAVERDRVFGETAVAIYRL
jgi:L-fuconolactonase